MYFWRIIFLTCFFLVSVHGWCQSINNGDKDGRPDKHLSVVRSNFQGETDIVRRTVQGKIEIAYVQIYNNQPYLAIETILTLLREHPKFSLADSIKIADVLSQATGNLGATAISIDYRLEHSRLLKQKGQNFEYYYSIENVAYLHTSVQNYDSANYYYTIAHEVANNLNSIPMLMHCSNNMGHNSYVRGHFSEALERYHQAVEYYKAIEDPVRTDSLLFGIVLGNTGNVYAHLHDYDSATFILKKSTDLLRTLNDQGIRDSLHYGNYLIDFARVEIIKGDFTSAEKMLDDAFTNVQNHPESLIVYLEVLAKLYEKTGRNLLARNTLKRLLERKEELSSRKTAVTNNVHALIKFQLEDVKKDYHILSKLVKTRRKVNSLRIQLIVGLSSLLLVIAGILFISYRSKQRKRNEILAIEKRMAELKLKNKSLESARLKEELNYKNSDLTDFAIDITRKHEFIKELLDKLNELQNSKNLNQDLNSITSYIRSQLRIDENLTVFQQNIDVINREFIALLHELYPELTLNERQMCALLRLQLTSKEIATVKNISPDSVKVLRHRIRKKMGLNPEMSLTKHLDSIL